MVFAVPDWHERGSLKHTNVLLRKARANRHGGHCHSAPWQKLIAKARRCAERAAAGEAAWKKETGREMSVRSNVAE